MSERFSELERTVARARADGDWRPLFRAIPYLSFMGLEMIEDAADGRLVCVLPEDPKFIGNPLLPALHGGVVGALLEAAAVIELMAVQETARVPKIINLTVDYLRSAKPVRTFAQGSVTKPGRRVASVHVEAWQGDRAKPVATANAHFLLA
ncbi:PaaI family thioesterase [Oceanibacterium hippocampi]|uniref:Thioesterase domain-containing protein n=1 Tax=Oceanibacterium hippocampi TaxID=745714 RepID=A0A1Y5S9Q0_9PROT|nr:PaaI family thioesterase [Oceanibacterium hippocampi]SLN35396.1 hypothetical protein OCH7691_01410 [Oceanibacterium hippocampi]